MSTWRATREWERTREIFCRIVAVEGVSTIADELPADRETIYRLLRGTTRRPTKAVRAGIERVIEEHAKQ